MIIYCVDNILWFTELVRWKSQNFRPNCDLCEFTKIGILRPIYEILNENEILKLQNLIGKYLDKLGQVVLGFKEESDKLIDEWLNGTIAQFEKYFSK